MNRDRIGPALGKIASGLYIATAYFNGAPVGMLCSFVEQAGFNPPMISAAFGKDRPILEALNGDGVFGLNILSKENGPLIKSFSRSDLPDPFEGHARVENEQAPQFADAWAFLICKVVNQMNAGDHVLYLAEVMDGVLQKEKQEAMVRIRQNGFGY
jgi:flavin reductase (DIM6/NTAB) family NADH-FMN oxidoreductase RutF